MLENLYLLRCWKLIIGKVSEPVQISFLIKETILNTITIHNHNYRYLTYVSHITYLFTDMPYHVIQSQSYMQRATCISNCIVYDPINH